MIKKGDKVVLRVKDMEHHHEMEERFYGMPRPMLELDGEICTVSRVVRHTEDRVNYSNGDIAYTVYVHENGFVWNDRCFEIIKDEYWRV